MKIIEQILCLITCFLVLAVAAINRDGRVAGYELGKKPAADAATATTAVDSITVTGDGTTVVNTTGIGADIKGYAGAVPLEIRIKDGKIQQVKALPNNETPDFFEAAAEILAAWDGLSPEEALAKKVDAVSGATFSSRAIISNVERGLAVAQNSSAEKSFLDKLDLSPKFIAGLLVVLMAAIVPLFTKNKRYRLVQLLLNVVVLGFWCGSFISYSLLVGYVSSGVDFWLSLTPIVMIVTAFVYPLFGKKQYYCMNICPFGSLQELAGKTNPHHKWHLSPKVQKRLSTFREILWAVLMLLMLTGVYSGWMDYEFFTAFIFRSASVVVIALAALMVILSVFVARPYCRFLCPTGMLFKVMK